MKINYYEVLGVEKSATEQEIRDRFRRLAREQHPDRYKGPDKADAERKFQTLTEAVNVLPNPARRQQHADETDCEAESAAGRGDVGIVLLSSRGIREHDAEIGSPGRAAGGAVDF